MKLIMTILAILALLSHTQCLADTQSTENPNQIDVTTMSKLHEFACNRKSKTTSPWGVNNLYNCETKNLSIPYHLWTGKSWDGNKTKNCMHTVNSTFNVDGDSLTTITGPLKWKNPKSGKAELVWGREKVDGSKTQYFTCHKKGIGRVFDSRRTRTYTTGRCKFPAGDGWKLGKRQSCKNTSIKITHLSFGNNGNLHSLDFKWWVNGSFDHIYRYIPDYGMSNAWKQ